MEELNRAIQNLPIEISEKIYKYCVSANLFEKKKELEWDYVHYQIKGAPFCSKHQSVVKVLLSRKPGKYYLYGLCSECFKIHELHLSRFFFPFMMTLFVYAQAPSTRRRL